MVTPVATFFRVVYQNSSEWLFAVGVGAGSLVLALVTKFMTRYGKFTDSGIDKMLLFC